MNFYGRKQEIAELLNQFNMQKSCSLIYGKRRVGKTSLILESSRLFSGEVIYYECIKSSAADNIERISRLIRDCENNDYLYFKDIIEIVDYLQGTNKKYLLILDEYQYLKNLEPGGVVDSMLQKAVDSIKDNVHIVLAGSYVSVMKELLDEDNPLFGRFSLILKVQNMDYMDSTFFYPQLPVVDKTMLYCIFGGNPYANDNINISKDLKYNIKELVLKQTGILRNYMDSVLLSELNKANNANKILMALSNGRKKYSELESYDLFSHNGLLDKNLKILLNMEIIEKSFPINFQRDRKKSFYSITDNFVRFYYSFIVGYEHYIRTLGEDVFYDKFIEPLIWQYVSLRFEDMVKEYFIRSIHNGILSDVLDIGRFWYNDPLNKISGEFDIVLRHFDNSYSFYEVKCHSSKMTKGECEKEKEQILSVVPKSGMEIRDIGFVSLNGFEFESEQYKLISGEELYY